MLEKLSRLKKFALTQDSFEQTRRGKATEFGTVIRTLALKLQVASAISERMRKGVLFFPFNLLQLGTDECDGDPFALDEGKDN